MTEIPGTMITRDDGKRSPRILRLDAQSHSRILQTGKTG